MENCNTLGHFVPLNADMSGERRTVDDFALRAVSSVVLRSAFRKQGKTRTVEVIPFRCTFLKRKCHLGKDTDVFVRVRYAIGETESEVFFSGKPLDILVEIALWGPKVVWEAHKWRLGSRVVRAALVEEQSQCVHCFQMSETHLFMKYDNLRSRGKNAVETIRICARCMIAFVEMMSKEDIVKLGKYTYVEPERETQWKKA